MYPSEHNTSNKTDNQGMPEMPAMAYARRRRILAKEAVQNHSRQQKPTIGTVGKRQLAVRKPLQSNATLTYQRILTLRMCELIPNHSDSYKDLFHSLPKQYQYLVFNTIIFKFEKRPRVASDNGRSFSKEAFFYLERLAKINRDLIEDPTSLVGLRCQCCSQHPAYLSGSTNFADIRNSAVDSNLMSCIHGRHKHMSICPYVPEDTRNKLVEFVPLKKEKDALHKYLMVWLQLLKDTYLKAKLPVRPFLRKRRTPTRKRNAVGAAILAELNAMAVTEDSMYDELAKSITLARKMKDAVVIFEDIMEPLSLDGSETPLMEDFLQNHQVRLTQCNNQWQVGLQCQRCNSNGNSRYHCISDVLTVDPNYDVISSELWQFVKKHSRECNGSPQSNKRLFENNTSDLPLGSLKSFLKAWKDHLQQFLGWTSVDIVRKHDVEAFVPLPIEMIQTHGFLPCYKVPQDAGESVGEGPKVVVNRNDVVLESERCRDLEGNRRFRNLISEHRALYLQVSSSQKALIESTIISLIKKKGGNFYGYRPGFGVYTGDTEKIRQHTKNALQNGFPEMLRPARCTDNKASKVYDVEHAPMMGVLHGDICWSPTSLTAPRCELSCLISGMRFKRTIPFHEIVHLESPQKAIGGNTDVIVIDDSQPQSSTERVFDLCSDSGRTDKDSPNQNIFDSCMAGTNGVVKDSLKRKRVEDEPTLSLNLSMPSGTLSGAENTSSSRKESRKRTEFFVESHRNESPIEHRLKSSQSKARNRKKSKKASSLARGVRGRGKFR